MDDDDGWDLDAVVRSCANISSAAASAGNITPAMDIVHEDDRGAAVAACSTAAVASISFHDGPPAHEQPSAHTNIISFSMQPVDSELHVRKRKSRNNKRVVEMREEELNNDGWAWRKYGQKPIKGSPYPRNYYRCSTTKDCSARRQVERSPINASNFIVSYSGDHLHPRPTHLSTLAGTTRSTRFNTMATSLVDQPACSSSSPASTSSISSATSLKEDETVTNDEDIKEVNFW